MNLKHIAMQGLLLTWSSVFYSQILNFISKIVLTRFLFPEDFGIMSLILSITSVINIIFTLGWTEKLIQKKENIEQAFQTVFTFLIIVGVISTSVMCICAPLIAQYFSTPSLTSLLRLYSLMFILFPISILYNTYLQKYFLFSKKIMCEILSSTLFFVTVIGLAYFGFGVWSLVIGQVIQIFFVVGWLYFFAREWNPHFSFNKQIFIEVLNFVKESGVGNILGILILTIDNLFIGKYAGVTALGYYSMAFALTTLFITVITISIGNVIFPVLTITPKKEDLKRHFIKAVHLNFVILTPLLFFSFLFAEPLITLLFSEKWIPSIILFKVLLIYTFFRAYCSLGSYLSLSLNSPHANKKIFFLELLCLSISLFPFYFFFGIVGIAYAVLLSRILSALLFAYFAKKTIMFSLKEHLLLFYKPVFLSAILSAISYYGYSVHIISSLFISFILIGIAYVLFYGILIISIDGTVRQELQELIALLQKNIAKHI